jgi:hypothetical protein
MTVGWIGTPTTASFLTPLAPVLRALAAEQAFEVQVAGSTAALAFDGVPTRNLPWSLDGEVELFNQCDIGVYPLPDDDWARGKCGFKAIQFMSCGVPVVASAVGVNREIVQDGVNGFLASTPDEWRHKLSALMGDANLRRRLGAAGRRTIQARYSLQVNGPRVAAVIGAALARTRASDAFVHVSGEQTMTQNFAITGVAGFVAPRHLNAIRDTGHRLVAAVDPHDAVGLLDRYSFGVRFFTEIERFESAPRKAAPRLRGRARALREHLLAELPPRRAHPSGAACGSACDLREADRHQPVESRSAAGSRT